MIEEKFLRKIIHLERQALQQFLKNDKVQRSEPCKFMFMEHTRLGDGNYVRIPSKIT